MTLLHLVGHDGTRHGDDALALARTIGAGRDLRRVVVHVIPSSGSTADAAPTAIDALDGPAAQRLEHIRGALREDEALTVLAAGSPAHGLHDHAERLGADLIAVGAKSPAHHLAHLPATSIADRLLAGGPCAVAVAPEGYAASAHALARILVGFDGSVEADNALHEAAALAACAGARVDVLHAHPFSPSYLDTLAPTDAAPAAAEDVAASGLASLPLAMRGASADQAGAAGPTIEAFAAARGADLVVLGSRGYGPIRSVLLGSTGAHLLHATDLALIILPRGTHATVPAGRDGFAVAA